jgi:hypothetical protein
MMNTNTGLCGSYFTHQPNTRLCGNHFGHQLSIIKIPTNINHMFSMIITLQPTRSSLTTDLFNLIKKILDHRHKLNVASKYTFMIKIISYHYPPLVTKHALLNAAIRLIPLYPQLAIATFINELYIIPCLTHQILDDTLD